MRARIKARRENWSLDEIGIVGELRFAMEQPRQILRRATTDSRRMLAMMLRRGLAETRATARIDFVELNRHAEMAAMRTEKERDDEGENVKLKSTTALSSGEHVTARLLRSLMK